MNLAMSKCHCFLPITMQVSETHSDHSRLFFLNVDKFNETFLTASFEVPSTALFSNSRGISNFSIQLCLVKHHLNVPFADFELVFLHDIQWSLNAASIRAELDLTLGEVSDD